MQRNRSGADNGRGPALELKLNTEVTRFACVGGLATVTHLTVAAILLRLIPAAPTLVINTIAFCIAFGVYSAGHRYFTFNRTGSPVKFMVTAVSGLIVNNSVVAVLTSLFDIRYAAILAGTAIAPVAVFILSKYWAFGEK